MGRRRVDPDISTYAGKIADRVRALRAKNRLTVQQLADSIGVDEKAMYAYENGSRTIPPDLYPKLATALGCKSPASFFPPLS